MPTKSTAASTATAVSAGFFQPCALLSNHTIKWWGLNASAQLGSEWHYKATPVSGQA
ncbi:MAG: hypothetical protein ABSC51_03930 [Gaiellaceae bacterium]